MATQSLSDPDNETLEAEPEIVESSVDPSVAPAKVDEDPSEVENFEHESNSTIAPSDAPLTLSVPEVFEFGDESELTDEAVGFPKNFRDLQFNPDGAGDDGTMERWMWAAAFMILSGAVGAYLTK